MLLSLPTVKKYYIYIYIYLLKDKRYKGSENKDAASRHKGDKHKSEAQKENHQTSVWKILYNQFWTGVLSWQNLIGQRSICCLPYMFLSVNCLLCPLLLLSSFHNSSCVSYKLSWIVTKANLICSCFENFMLTTRFGNNQGDTIKYIWYEKRKKVLFNRLLCS